LERGRFCWWILVPEINLPLASSRGSFRRPLNPYNRLSAAAPSLPPHTARPAPLLPTQASQRAWACLAENRYPPHHRVPRLTRHWPSSLDNLAWATSFCVSRFSSRWSDSRIISPLRSTRRTPSTPLKARSEAILSRRLPGGPLPRMRVSLTPSRAPQPRRITYPASNVSLFHPAGAFEGGHTSHATIRCFTSPFSF